MILFILLEALGLWLTITFPAGVGWFVLIALGLVWRSLRRYWRRTGQL